MSKNNANNISNEVRHSDPIPIASRMNGRGRSASVSSASSGSASSTFDLPNTPLSASSSSQRVSIPSPGSSPILSYFLAQSPTTKTPTTGTFSFKRGFGTTPVFEADEECDKEIPVAAHARRASTHVANRFAQPQATPLPEPRLERGTALLRRLSLSSAAFVKPQQNVKPMLPPSPPPNTAVSPTASNMPFTNKPRRSATLSSDARPRRAPSPMGERILKGHFDGFN